MRMNKMQISNLNRELALFSSSSSWQLKDIYIVHQTIYVSNKSNENFARIVCNILFVFVVWVEDLRMSMVRRHSYPPWCFSRCWLFESELIHNINNDAFSVGCFFSLCALFHRLIIDEKAKNKGVIQWRGRLLFIHQCREVFLLFLRDC